MDIKNIIYSAKQSKPALVFIAIVLVLCTAIIPQNIFANTASAFFWGKEQTDISTVIDDENKNKWVNLKDQIDGQDAYITSEYISTTKNDLQIEFDTKKEELDAELLEIESELKNPKITERYKTFVDLYQSKYGELFTKLDAIEGNIGDTSKVLELDQTIEQMFGENEAIHNPAPFRAVENESFPTVKIENLNYQDENELNLESINLNTSTLDDKTQAIQTYEPKDKHNERSVTENLFGPKLMRDASYNSALESLAEDLGYDPLNIYNYVYNTITFTPYYGVKKGAYNTYLEKTGNDMDTSLLLQDLLEISGYEVNIVSGKILLTPEQAKNWLAMDDTMATAQQLANSKIPLAVYVDADDQPVYILIEHTWVEAQLPYANYRGTDTSSEDYEWIPLDASLKETYASQIINAPDEMSFSSADFFENYLQGEYTGTPVEAMQSQIEDFLTSTYDTLSYEDALTDVNFPGHNFEFLPNTLPYTVVEELSNTSTISSDFDHEIEYSVTNSEGVNLLATSFKVEDIANKQVVLGFEPATTDDQSVIDYYGSIYLTPPYLIEVMPVLRVNGAILATGLPVIGGDRLNFGMNFWVPTRQISETTITQYQREDIELNINAGNDMAIAINTDRIVQQEFYQDETTSSEFWSDQKLYKTALNYLERVAQNQEAIGRIFGGSYTNVATRAFVFNGVEVNTLDGVAQSFEWKGLRLDSSAVINYFPYFGERGTHLKEFNTLFGLSSSLDESSIFEEDFGVEAMSTVKGIKLINAGSIPGINIVTIDSSNISTLDSLDISEGVKTLMREDISDGHTVYTASKAFTYLDWNGLVYISLDADGDGSYVIGEGLNGGYTVEEFGISWTTLLIYQNLGSITASIILPADGAVYTRGSCVPYEVYYEGSAWLYPDYNWTEEGCFDTAYLKEGIYYIASGYGTDEIVTFTIHGDETAILNDFVQALEDYVEKNGNYQATSYVCISLLIDKMRDATDKHEWAGWFSDTVDSKTTIPDAGADGFMRNVFPYRDVWWNLYEATFHFQDTIERSALTPGNIVVYDWTDENGEHGSDGTWDHVSAIVDIDDSGYRTYIYSTGKGGVIKRVEETWIRARLAGFESLSAEAQETNCAKNDSDDNNLGIIPGEIMLLEPDTYSSDYPKAYACVARSSNKEIEYNVSDYIFGYVKWSDIVLYKN